MAGFRLLYDDNTTVTSVFPVVRYISDFSPYEAGEPDLQHSHRISAQTVDAYPNRTLIGSPPPILEIIVASYSISSFQTTLIHVTVPCNPVFKLVPFLVLPVPVLLYIDPLTRLLD